MGEVVPFRAGPLTGEQKDYFHGQAAYWQEVQEMASRQLEYATNQREYALRMLGMLAIDGGYPEETA